MQKKSVHFLDKLILEKGRDLTSGEANSLRKRLKVVTSMDKKTFDYFYKCVFKKHTSKVEKMEIPLRRIKNETGKLDKLLDYKEALNYVRGKNTGLDSEIVLANTDSLNKGEKFLYKVLDINSTIFMMLRNTKSV